MIAGCPKCSARYRVDAEKIGPNGAKLRCTRCSAVFLVRSSRAEPAGSTSPSAPSTPSMPASVDPTAGGGPSSSAAATSPAVAPAPIAPPARPEASSEVDPARLVLIADPDESRGKASADAIATWGLVPLLVLDGVEAMLAIQRRLPAAVVLDAALPKMFGFQVCEVVKRNESLRRTFVVLVGSVHDRDRYRREPSDLYGADAYVEGPDLPDALQPLLQEAGLPVVPAGPRGAASAKPEATIDDEAIDEQVEAAAAPVATSQPGPRVAMAPPVAPDREPASMPGPDPEDPERAEERERARRLARIAVSEMLLYQPEKFDEANRAGTLEQVLDLEIQEARALLRQRISEAVRAETDFVMDELQRVASERSEQG